MRLGSSVPGLITPWRFVAQDLHDIARRVRELDRDARLAVETTTGQLGIVRNVVLEAEPGSLTTDPHDTWIIGFRATDDDGEPLTGEPDARVLELMRRYDSWAKRNPVRFRQAAELAARQHEARTQQFIRERAREFAEEYLFAGRRYAGIRHNIFVPADLPRGQG